MKKTSEIKNFFNEQEIAWFNWYWKIIPKKTDTGQRLNAMARYEQPFFAKVRAILQDKINKHNPNEIITTVNINDDYAPGGIHSDGYIEYDKNDDVASTYLIPIAMDDKSYATVIFDYTSKKAVSLNDQLGLGNKGLVTYPQATRDDLALSSEPFDKELYRKYLYHLKYESLAGLKVIDVQHWEIGKAIVWPRENFHCSAAFDNTSGRKTVLIATKNEIK